MDQKSERHAIRVSFILHLLPGILTGIVFVAAAPSVQSMNFPPFVVHAFVVILVPVMYSVRFFARSKKNVRLSLEVVYEFSNQTHSTQR